MKLLKTNEGNKEILGNVQNDVDNHVQSIRSKTSLYPDIKK